MVTINPIVRVTLSSKGLITLPKALLDQKQWKPGNKFVFEAVPEGVMVRLFSSVD